MRRLESVVLLSQLANDPYKEYNLILYTFQFTKPCGSSKQQSSPGFFCLQHWLIAYIFLRSITMAVSRLRTFLFSATLTDLR